MSIPTSLIVVLLVAAWLVVLVPMVARSRERVPRTDEATATSRVLSRATRTLRRRPGPLRSGGRDRAGVAERGGDLMTITGDRPDHDLDSAGTSAEPGGPADAADEWASVQATARRRTGATPVRTVDDDDTVRIERVRSGSSPLAAADHHDHDHHHHDPEHEHDGIPVSTDAPDGPDDARLRPVPRRAGRGGYDPDAAEQTRAYRFARRRRVALALLILAVGFALAAWLVTAALWVASALSGLLLVGFLVYLRRQVRVEADIRRRRQQRLERARQIRPEYGHRPRRAPAPASGPAGSVGSAGPTGPAPSAVPALHRSRVVVDLDDDDPGFDDLERFQPVEYRRAVGQ